MGFDGPGATGAGVQRNPFSTSIPHTLKTGKITDRQDCISLCDNSIDSRVGILRGGVSGKNIVRRGKKGRVEGFRRITQFFLVREIMVRRKMRDLRMCSEREDKKSFRSGTADLLVQKLDDWLIQDLHKTVRIVRLIEIRSFVDYQQEGEISFATIKLHGTVTKRLCDGWRIEELCHRGPEDFLKSYIDLGVGQCGGLLVLSIQNPLLQLFTIIFSEFREGVLDNLEPKLVAKVVCRNATIINHNTSMVEMG